MTSAEAREWLGVPGTPMVGHATTAEDVVWAFKLLMGRTPNELDLERTRIHFRTYRELVDWMLSVDEFKTCTMRRRQQAVSPQIVRWGGRLLLQTELTDEEAEAWSQKWDNLDTFVHDVLASEARKNRVPHAVPRESTSTSIVLTKSMPRSGHHLLMNLICEYFRSGVHYCEFYGGGEACCHSAPCHRPYHPLLKNKIFVQKSHDNEFEDATDLPHSYLVQYRHPIPRLQSNYDHACRVVGRNRSYEDFVGFAKSETDYYIRFYEKWILHPTPSTFILAYEDLLDHPHRSMSELTQFLEPDTAPREAELRRALSLLRVPSGSNPDAVFKRRKLEAHEFFDAALYRDLEQQTFAACPGLSFDRLF